MMSVSLCLLTWQISIFQSTIFERSIDDFAITQKIVSERQYSVLEPKLILTRNRLYRYF